MTALQPPPPSSTHTVNPDHSAFGTTTLHADNRSADPSCRRCPHWRDRVLFSACGQEIFVAGDFNHVARVVTATREYAEQRQPIRPAPPACVVPLVLDHLLYLCTHIPPRLSQLRQRGLRLSPQWFRRSRTHPYRFTSCAHPPPVFPITLWFRRDGTQMNFVCGFLFGTFP